MVGPHPPHYGIGGAGPPGAHPRPTEPMPGLHGYAGHFRGPAPPPGPPPPPAYPGPSAPYPRRPRRRLLATGAAVSVVVAALVAVFVAAVRAGGPGATITEDRAAAAIQGYLDALSNHEIETVARNSLCGIYDEVREKRSDDAVAKLNSDAFGKQFAEAEVTSVDKIVHLSEYQAQVLFTMRVVSASGEAERDDVQGVAQLLATGREALVCSYVLHTSGTY